MPLMSMMTANCRIGNGVGFFLVRIARGSSASVHVSPWVGKCSESGSTLWRSGVDSSPLVLVGLYRDISRTSYEVVSLTEHVSGSSKDKKKDDI